MPGPEDSLNDPVERSALIAALVTGRCTPDEARRLQQASRRDPQLAREIELMELLRRHMQIETEELPLEWGWQRLKRDLRNVRESRAASQFRWLPAASAALLLLCVVQGVLLWKQEDPGLRLLGADAPSEHLQLSFSLQATESEIQALLRDVGAEIVAGPSSAGLYRLRLRKPEPTREEIEAAIHRLRADSAVSYVDQEP